MSRHTTKLTRLAVIGLSACALLPAAASAMPINDGRVPAQHVVGQAIAGGGGPGVTAQKLSSPAHTGGSDVVSGGGYVIPKSHHATPATGGDVVSRGGYVIPKSHHATPATGGDVVSGGGYTIPSVGSAAPQPPNFPTNTKALPVPSAKSTDDGIDTGVLIALGAAALLAIGGLGLVMATRPRTRRRQPA